MGGVEPGGGRAAKFKARSSQMKRGRQVCVWDGVGRQPGSQVQALGEEMRSGAKLVASGISKRVRMAAQLLCNNSSGCPSTHLPKLPVCPCQGHVQGDSSLLWSQSSPVLRGDGRCLRLRLGPNPTQEDSPEGLQLLRVHPDSSSSGHWLELAGFQALPWPPRIQHPGHLWHLTETPRLCFAQVPAAASKGVWPQ